VGMGMKFITVSFSSLHPPVLRHFVADNVDHNIQTLNGSGTYRGMGIISARMQSSALHAGDNVKLSVPRLPRRLPSEELSKHSGVVTIAPYHKTPKAGLATLSWIH